MTDDRPSLASDEEFNQELQGLLRRAYNQDINVEGGWECRNGPEHPDWDVVIAEVRKNHNTD